LAIRCAEVPILRVETEDLRCQSRHPVCHLLKFLQSFDWDVPTARSLGRASRKTLLNRFLALRRSTRTFDVSGPLCPMRNVLHAKFLAARAIGKPLADCSLGPLLAETPQIVH
jgi:hypothetical protein